MGWESGLEMSTRRAKNWMGAGWKCEERRTRWGESAKNKELCLGFRKCEEKSADKSGMGTMKVGWER